MLRFYRVRYLMVKELRTVLRDPKTRVVLVLPPLVQLLVFSFAATHEVRNVALGVYNRDSGRASRDLIARLQAAKETFSRLVPLEGPEEVRTAIEHGDVLAVVHFGLTFTRDLEQGPAAQLQILLDGRRAHAAQVVQSYIQRIVQGFLYERDRILFHGRVPWRRQERVRIRVWFNPNVNPIWSVAPALVAILVNLVGLMVTALSVARERELGTFEQLLVSPLRPLEILVGKALPAMGLAFIEGLVMVAMVRLLFRVPFRGSLITLIVAMLLFLLAVVGIGLFVSSLVKTQQQAFLGAFTYMVPAVLLSGFATPVANIPGGLRWLAYLDPLQYMISVSRALFLEGASMARAFQMIWPLLPIGMLTLGAAAWLFRHRLE